jgi:hypothetical protein
MSVMTQAMAIPGSAAPIAERVWIDFLFLDLTTCDRCRGTDRNLESALEVVREVLEATGAAVEVRKTLVETADQARELRFVSSPTIRVNGRDLAFELKESACGCDACTDASGAPIACRDWTYRGQEYTEAPVGLIVDAILGEVYRGAVRPTTIADDRYELPENLERFYAAEGPGCGSPAAPESCCEPAATADCCAPSTARGCDC